MDQKIQTKLNKDKPNKAKLDIKADLRKSLNAIQAIKSIPFISESIKDIEGHQKSKRTLRSPHHLSLHQRLPAYPKTLELH